MSIWPPNSIIGRGSGQPSARVCLCFLQRCVWSRTLLLVQPQLLQMLLVMNGQRV
jgi:hypothetical protein